MMETMIPPQVGMRLRTNIKKGEAKKSPRKKRIKKKRKNERESKKGHSNTTLVL